MIRLVDSDVSDETDIYMTSLCDARYVDWTLELLGDYCVEHVLMTHLCELIHSHQAASGNWTNSWTSACVSGLGNKFVLSDIT